ncbi:hypothetical protein K435DRAFT_753384 [Dendrothele bispora CBS 962.96]|uniref:Transmembrane protein n=1 Tax=Dendrothele bispora (strain CBS 962.96) TaxID=1314807 RepID=A0A4S8M6T2_DENBC|nr:hypothetical protein K435DRAFT_753384 [Dendrothele bispora CBS 962.96]
MSNSTLPNPNVYLAHLPPTTASQFEVSRNIYIGTLGALIWDMLFSLPEEIYLIRHFNPNMIAYISSRITALLYVLLSVIAKTTPGPDCVKLEHTITSCWVIAISSSSFLFLRRVLAVYQDSKLIRYSFMFLWVANVGVSILTPVGSRAGPLANTGYCINGGIEHYVGGATIMPLIFDSLVFLFVSYRILTTHGPGEEEWTWSSLFSSGKALPRLSRAMLRGGQQYYLVTVGVNILITVLITTPSVPPIYEATFTIPDIALTSSMACRVYRNLYFREKYTNGQGSTGITSLSMRFGHGTTQGTSRFTPGHGTTFESTTGTASTNGGLTVVPDSVSSFRKKHSIPGADIEQGNPSADNISLPEMVFKTTA